MYPNIEITTSPDDPQFWPKFHEESLSWWKRAVKREQDFNTFIIKIWVVICITLTIAGLGLGLSIGILVGERRQISDTIYIVHHHAHSSSVERVRSLK